MHSLAAHKITEAVVCAEFNKNFRLQLANLEAKEWGMADPGGRDVIANLGEPSIFCNRPYPCGISTLVFWVREFFTASSLRDLERIVRLAKIFVLSPKEALRE